MKKDRIDVINADIYAGKHVVYCQGKGPDDPKCLEKHPPKGMQMVNGHICGSGCGKSGRCDAVFAEPNKYPEFFQEPL